jgi:hypothetical protein
MDSEGKHEEEKKGKASIEYRGSIPQLDDITLPPVEFPDWSSLTEKIDILICTVDLIKANSEGLISDEEFEKLIQMAKCSDEEIRNLVKSILNKKLNKDGNI